MKKCYTFCKERRNLNMSEHNNQSSFDKEEFKKIKEQIKQAYTENKAEYENQKNKDEKTPKQSLVNKILGIIILIVIIVMVVAVMISNFELLFLPKNSVTITVNDQNGNVIDGLKLYISNEVNSYTIEFDENSSSTITELGVEAGDYTLTFEEIPNGYTCSEVTDSFTLSEGGKVKINYECIKENE